MKNILIIGKNSYIGTSLVNLLMQEANKYQVDTVSARDELWRKIDFKKYDSILHMAGIVHKKENPEMKELYFKVNRDLPVEVAIKAKQSGVPQFIFMSTMSVYGEEGNLEEEVSINRDTSVSPKNLYGKSKMEAEIELNKLNDDIFKIVILRPPMVYGDACPGNYTRLKNIAIKSPIFPMVNNKRSMVHIDKLCHFIQKYIDDEVSGLYFPQDDEYVNTSLMVKKLAEINGKKIHLSKIAGLIINKIGKKNRLIKKVFGNLFYEKI